MLDSVQRLCNLAQMDWDDLQIVLAVSRGRSLSQAGTLLSVTHTTIGRRLKALEEGLGVRLFDRTPDGLMPTPAGQDLAEVAEGVEAQVLAAEGRVMGRDVRLSGQLRVTTFDLLLRQHQQAFLSFVARYPSVELTLISRENEASLTRREADVAVRMTRTPPPSLVGRKVGQVEFAVYAAESLVEQVGADAPLSAYPWLHWDARLEGAWLDGWLAQHAPGARIALRMDLGTVMIREVVASGVGAHFLACHEGDADETLRRIGPVASEFTRDVWVLTLPDLRHTPRVRAFMDHMVEALTSG